MVDQATDISARQSPKHRLGMLAVLGGLSAFGPLAMDMYLPATPTIAAGLHAGQSLVQLTLSGCLAGLAVGQLVAGPISDESDAGGRCSSASSRSWCCPWR